MERERITVETVVLRPRETVWEKWTTPKDIMNWNNATQDWYTPSSVNDLRTGGVFHSIMASRDGSASFDFSGVYDDVVYPSRIAYTLGDGRKVVVEFTDTVGGVLITEIFETEDMYPPEMQRAGWQAILDNFKRYAETAEQERS